MSDTEFYRELKAIAHKTQFGILDLRLNIHRGIVSASTLYGKIKVRKHNNLANVQAIIERLKGAEENKQTAVIRFEVDIRSGRINEVSWNTEYQKDYTRGTTEGSKP